MNKLLIILFIVVFLILLYLFPRIVEIYKPVDMKKVEWNELYSLEKLDKDYVAQGIEVYKNFLFFTVHKKDKSSDLIVFKIENNNKLVHFFTTTFPSKATHVSDLSVYLDFLYAIDYASNNLYKIDIKKTIDSKKMIINKVYPTYFKRSGSIIVTRYNNEEVIFISQFILNKYIKVYKLKDISNKNKNPIMKIKSKYFIQGLYEKNNYFFISSNKSEKDIIFILQKSKLLNNHHINNSKIITINGAGNMIEDIVVYKGFIITSDEETNKIYISKNKLSKIIEK